MANPSREKGTRWENLVAGYLRDHGFPEVFRMATAGDHDAGDLGGIPAVAWECRDRSKIELAKNVDDANSRAHHKGARYGVAVMKRRGRKPEDAYVVCDLETFTRILQALNADDPTSH